MKSKLLSIRLDNFKTGFKSDQKNLNYSKS